MKTKIQWKTKIKIYFFVQYKSNNKLHILNNIFTDVNKNKILIIFQGTFKIIILSYISLSIIYSS